MAGAMSSDSGTIGGGAMPSIGVSAGSVARPQTARRLSSAELLAGAREAVIVHGQDEYRLRLTSNGKLILTK